MSPVEYVVGFVAIIVGIAIADIAASLHRLLRARSRVRWHWYPLSAAFLLILLTLELWWNLAFFERADVRVTIGMFLPWVFGLILLYLLASAALPDEVPAEGIDLKSYYFEHQRYFWMLYAGLIGFFILQRLGLVWALQGPAVLPRVLWNIIPNLVLIGLIISLAYVRKSWWHGLWLFLLPILMLAVMFDRPLT
jgi:hydrogenase/urease accessory protein HupE